jgi:hypothetical protein
MKKLAMTICGVAFNMAAFAQVGDSSTNDNQFKSDFRIQNPSINQPSDSQSIYSPQYSPQRQQQTSPLIRQRFQTEPTLQYQQQQPQPGIRLQPLQTNPQIPSQTQPLDLNNSGNQNQLNQRIQPAQEGSGAQRPG